MNLYWLHTITEMCLVILVSHYKDVISYLGLSYYKDIISYLGLSYHRDVLSYIGVIL